MVIFISHDTNMFYPFVFISAGNSILFEFDGYHGNFFLMRAVWRQFNRARFPITSVQGKPTSSFKINSSIYTFKPFKVKTWLDKYTSFIAVTLAACNRRQFCPMITTKSIICMGNRGVLISGVSHQVAK